MSKQFNLGFALFLLISDLALVVAALFLATQARILIPFGKEASALHWRLPLPVYGLAVGVWGLTFIALDVYNPKRVVHLVGEIQTVTAATMFSFLVLTGALYLSYRYVSRLQVLYFGALYLTFISAHRIALRGFFKLRGGRKYGSRRVLIVGTGDIAREVGHMVREHAWAGLYLVGFVGDECDNGQGKIPDAPVIGSLSQTLALVQQYQVEEVVIALPVRVRQYAAELVRDLQALPVNIRFVPDVFDLAFLQVRVEDFGGMPLLSLKEPTLAPFQRLTKRAFDLVLTSLLLIPALPLMAMIAAAIKLGSPGPVLFKQERVGEGGRLFGMYKFRSMVADAEQQRDEVVTVDDEGRVYHKHADDPRVTRMGRFLRRFSLDELPQSFNVLKGEMSLVGPRPEMPWLVEKYEPWQRKRFEVPQGMTGWWQVNGRGQPMYLHVEDDLFYIRHYSLWLDVKILWRTIWVAVSGQGAY
jgi:exopolysaccharide biosynthesis polyprenyl glycosylphosphotransferase